MNQNNSIIILNNFTQDKYNDLILKGKTFFINLLDNEKQMKNYNIDLAKLCFNLRLDKNSFCLFFDSEGNFNINLEGLSIIDLSGDKEISLKEIKKIKNNKILLKLNNSVFLEKGYKNDFWIDFFNLLFKNIKDKKVYIIINGLDKFKNLNVILKKIIEISFIQNNKTDPSKLNFYFISNKDLLKSDNKKIINKIVKYADNIFILLSLEKKTEQQIIGNFINKNITKFLKKEAKKESLKNNIILQIKNKKDIS